MELAISPPIIISSWYLKLPGTKEKHPLYSKLQLLATLMSNQSYLQHQFRQMHKRLYQQHGVKLPKQNITVYSKDGETFIVKGVSVHCNQIQCRIIEFLIEKFKKVFSYNSLVSVRSALVHWLQYIINHKMVFTFLNNVVNIGCEYFIISHTAQRNFHFLWHY